MGEVIQDGIEVTEELNPEAFIGVDPEDVQREIAKRFSLPETALVSEILQKIIDESGHQVPLAYLVMVANLCGANLQLYISDNDDLENPRTLD